MSGEIKSYPYGKQSIDESDIKAVLKVLSSSHLTCGPKVSEFEQQLCDYTGAKYAVAVNSATSGLHLAIKALGIKAGDEVITSPITFVASANCALYEGAFVRFADIDPKTANIAPDEIAKQITPKTKAIIPVHFAGQSCDMKEIYKLAKERGLFVIEDAAHAVGSEYKGKKVGSCLFSDMAVFSFHPVKTITTAEGGAVLTNDEKLYHKLCALRSHGVYKDGAMTNDWRYEMRELGFNYRMSDIHAALGLSQLKRLKSFKARRRAIVEFYNKNLGLEHLEEKEFSNACFHLYVALLDNRDEFYFKAKENGLNLQVHYIPVHTQPFYRALGYREGDYPNAEAYYKKCISLPLYPSLEREDLEIIAGRIKKILEQIK